MDYASAQRNAKRNLVGLTSVVLLHVFVIYALMTGLGQKTLKVLVKPLETKIIEEVIPLPPPPPPPPPPPRKVEQAPPKVEAPPPPFVPPPEVVVAAPVAPVISSVSVTPPVVMPVIAPPPPPPAPAPIAVVAIPAPPPPAPPPPPPPKPKVRSGVTPTHKEECTYPRQALRKGIPGGEFMTLLNIDEKGNVTKVELLEGKRTDGFDRELERCLIGWKFEADGGKYQVKAPFEFKLTE